MKFIINVEFFKFWQKMFIRKGERGKNKWYKAYYNGLVEDEDTNIWSCQIRINTLYSPITQIRSFIHECVHCIVDVFQTFLFHKRKLNAQKYNIDLPNQMEENLCNDTDTMAYVFFRRYFRRKIKK